MSLVMNKAERNLPGSFGVGLPCEGLLSDEPKIVVESVNINMPNALDYRGKMAFSL